MYTYFAPAERAERDEIVADIEFVSESPVLTGLLGSVSGILAVLNAHRQILAVNDAFLKAIGIDDPAGTLGLRPGEALQCVHADEEPGGCGTSRFCSSCGAAIAIVSGLEDDKGEERICALTAGTEEGTVDKAMLVRSQPVRIGGKRFLLLFLQDITEQQQRAALERTFFHDINNLLGVLIAASGLLNEDSPSEHARTVHRIAQRLKREVGIQSALVRSEAGEYRPDWQEVETHKVLEDVQTFFSCHPKACDRAVVFEEPFPAVSLQTDLSLLHRVLCNMITNALEATEDHGHVDVWLEHDAEQITFCVRNAGTIPRGIAGRMFQRNFTTKAGAGRGVGTYSMKLFGEKILGGNVTFTSSETGGTVFRLSLPRKGTTAAR